MANFFQNILSPDNYLYWFPPNEDKSEESVIYIHFNLPNSNASFILNKKNTSRYNVIKKNVKKYMMILVYVKKYLMILRIFSL